MKSLYPNLAVPRTAMAMRSRHFFLFFFLFTASRLAALDYYWVNGDGKWSEFATHWAKIPVPLVPGDFYNNVPGAADDVHFTDNGGVPYTLDVDAGLTIPKCHNMDWTGVPAGTVWGGSGSRIDIYGSTTLDANMSITFSGQVYMIALGAMSNIASHSVHFNVEVIFTGTAGGWDLVDDFYVNGRVSHEAGLIETNGHKVTIGDHFFGNYYGTAGVLHLGSSEFVILGGHAYLWYLPSQFDAGTSHFKLYAAGAHILAYNQCHIFDATFYSVGNFAYGHVDGKMTFHGFAYIHSYSVSVVPLLNEVIFLEGAHFYDGNDYNHLTLTAGKTYTVQEYTNADGADQTILLNGTLTALGAGSCDQFITIRSWQYGTPVRLVNNSGVGLEVHCAILQDVHAAGGNTLTVLDGVDLGNNLGWIFQDPHGMMDLYWIGGAGDWDDFNHWSETDGGMPGTCIPNGATNVYFTANSGFSAGNNLVNVPVEAYCRDMDWTGVTGMPVTSFGGGYLYVYGSLTLVPPSEMTFNYPTYLHFRATGPSTITSAGQPTFNWSIFEGDGSWEFADNFTSGAVAHSDGTVNTLGNTLNVGTWYGNYVWPNLLLANKGAELWLGVVGGSSSTVNVGGQFYCSYEPEVGLDPENFHAVESEIIGSLNVYVAGASYHKFWKVTFPNTTGGYGYFSGSILNKLTYAGTGIQYLYGTDNVLQEVEMQGEGIVQGSNTFESLTITGGFGYELPYGGIQTITATGSLNVVNADCKGMANLHVTSNYPHVTALIRKEGVGNNLTLNHVILDNVFPDLTSGATYNATNSVGLQPQVIADWNITNPTPRSLHWVDGTGDWHDAAHWSLSSNGPGGECPPTPVDDVFFDSGSGLTNSSDVVTVSQLWAFCKNMDWTGVTGGAKFASSRNGVPTNDPTNNLEIFGNLKFSAGMQNDFYSNVWFRADHPVTIESNGNHFRDYMFFNNPNGDWSLVDDLWCEHSIFQDWGKFRTNNHDVSIGAWWYNTSYQPTTEAFLGTSTLTFKANLYYSAACYLYYLPGNFHGEAASLVFEDNISNPVLYAHAYPIELHNVTFKAPNAVLYGASVNNKLVFEKTGTSGVGGDIHEAEFHDDFFFNDSRNYHSIKFFPGKRYNFYPTSIQTIVPHNGVEGQFIAQGLPGQYIEMKSTDFNSPAIIHMDDIDGGTTCTKYLFLTAMDHTGTEDIYVPTPGGNVFNNDGWQFFPCNPCPASIPELDPQSITVGCAPGHATLILDNLRPDEWANWYTDPAAVADLVYSGGNLFQPLITGPTTYYARVYSDGGLCESTVILSVDITITTPPPAYNVTGGGQVCVGSSGVPVGLDDSDTNVSYQLQLNGVDLGSPILGTGAAITFGNQTDPGTYTIWGTTIGTGCPGEMNGSALITGDPNQAPAILAGSNSPLCIGSGPLYLTESGGELISWSWTGPNGFSSSDQNPNIHSPTPAESGDYTVSGEGANGCSNSETISVTINPQPDATITTDPEVCAGSVGNIASVPDAGPGAIYTWSILNGTITAGLGTRSITYTAGVAGPVVLYITLESGSGCYGAGCSNTFIQSLGDMGGSQPGIFPHPNGDFFATGLRNDSMVIVRFDPSGVPRWAKAFMFGTNTILIRDMMVDASGDLIGVAYFETGSANDARSTAFRYDMTTHTFVWVQHISNVLFTNVIDFDADECILTGLSTSGFTQLMRISKADGTISDYALQGEGGDYYSVLENGHLYGACRRYYNGFGDFRASVFSHDAATGAFEWQNSIISEGDVIPGHTQTRMYPEKPVIDNDSIVVLASGDLVGFDVYNTGPTELVVAKTNLTGDVSWTKQYVMAGYDRPQATRIANTADGYYIVGNLWLTSVNNFGFGILLKVDKQGNLQWAKRLGISGKNIVKNIMERGGFLHLTMSSDSYAPNELLLLKLDQQGNSSDSCDFIQPIDVTVIHMPTIQNVRNYNTSNTNNDLTALNVTPDETPAGSEERCGTPCSNSFVVDARSPNAGNIFGVSILCQGDFGFLQTDGDPGGVWDSSDPSVAFIDPITGVVQANSPGFVFITYTVDVNGCISVSGFDLEVLSKPAVQASSNSPVCEGANELLLFETGGEAIGWSWTGPNNFMSTNQNPIIPNPTAAESGDYTVVVTGQSGCTNVATTSVVVAPASLPRLEANSIIRVAQPGGQVTLILENLPPGYEAVWYADDQVTILYADVANFFQTNITQPTTFYGQYRDLNSNCESPLLEIGTCLFDYFSKVAPFSSAPIGAAPGIKFAYTFGTDGGTDDTGRMIVALPDSTYVMAGDGANNCGDRDIYLVKSNCAGDIIWQHAYGGPDHERISWLMENGLQQTPDGGYLIVGETRSYGNGELDNILIKTDADGNQQWVKTYGGARFDHSRGITFTSDGGYLITVYSFSDVPPDFAIHGDIQLIKTDANGNIQWQKLYPKQGWQSPYVGIELPNGGYLTAGTYGLTKVDVNGNELWERPGVPGIGYILEKTADGGVMYGGRKSAGQDGFMWRLDGNGDPVWPTEATIPGPGENYVYVIKERANGNFMCAGEHLGMGAGAWDFWFFETDPNGSLLWERTFGSPGNEWATSMKKTVDGDYIAIGLSYGYDNVGKFLTVKLDIIPDGPPVLDPASVTSVQSGDQATLILQNLPLGYAAVWYDSDQVTELYADDDNLFQPIVNASQYFYGAMREISTGCESDKIPVLVCAPNIEATSNAPVCTGNTLQFNEIGGQATTWSWTGPLGFTSPDQNPSIPNVSLAHFGLYSVSITDSLGCSTSDSINVSIVQTPSLDPPNSQVVCNNNLTTAVNFSGMPNGVVFKWTNNAPSIGLAANGMGNIAAFTAINTSNAPVVATITVTPEYTANGITCSGTSLTFTITVNPTPTVADPPDQSVCAGQATAAVTFSGTVNGTVFKWTNNNTSIGLAAAGTGNIASFVAINNGPTPVVATITVTPEYTNGGITCTGPSQTFTITVNPLPQLFNISGQTLYCTPNDPGAPVGLSGSQVGVNYQLFRNGTPVGAPLAGTGGVLDFGLQSAGTYTVVATRVAGGCTRTMSGSLVVQSMVCSIEIADPCSCKNNATTLLDGQFDERIKINAPSWQNWTVKAVSGLYRNNSPAPPAAPNPVLNGSAFNPLGGNMFDLNGVLVDAIGYTITATNGFTDLVIPLRACYYPNPTLLDLGGPYCLNTDDITLAAKVEFNPVATSANFNVNGAVLPATFNAGNGNWEAIYDITALGAYQVYFTFDAGTPTANNPADPGCIQRTASQFFNVIATPSNLVCNDFLYISLDADCSEQILPDQVLDGSYGCYDDYIVEIDRTAPYGNGPWEPALLNAGDIGKTYVYRVTHLPSGNICWGNLKVEDKLPPALICENFSVPCNTPNLAPNYLFNILGIAPAVPTATDCQNIVWSHIDIEFPQQCDSGLTSIIRRFWTATDASGNSSTCEQFIWLLRPTLADVVAPPDYDGFGAPAFSCEDNLPIVNGRRNPTPDWIESQGLQGYPYVFGQPSGCTINWAWQDYPIDICDGTVKYRREWTIVDWCFGDGFEYNQIIKVVDETGPSFTCPANLSVSTDPFTCCATIDLPDVVVEDNCSRINKISGMVVVRDQYTGQTLNMVTVGGTLSDFSGNNWWQLDTLAAFGFTPCLPVGEHTVTYVAHDDCGNTASCNFDLIVRDFTPPVAACDETTVVAIGVDDLADCYTPTDGCEFAGVTWLKASTLNDGSYDNCNSVQFTVRRMEPYSDCINSLSDDPCYLDEFGDFIFSEDDLATAEYDSIKFYCCEVGTTQTVILRVYQIDVNGNIMPGPDGNPLYNECMIQVEVQDKLKPSCLPPANVTVNCENFDPSLWAYGKAQVADNCCLDTSKVYQGLCGLTHTAAYNNFDTVCNKGTIVRTFRAFDCHGFSSQCTQRVVVTYEQDYFVKFPNDAIVTVCDGTGIYGEPVFFGEDCELLGVSFEDEIFTVVPDACFKIERSWSIINWCTYNPNLPCINVPNPNPNPQVNNPANLAGPTVSECGTLPPWAPTIVRINPTDPQPTNFCTFWDKNANCYKYKQIIKIIDGQAPTGTFVTPACDNQNWLTANHAELWNEPYWWDNGLQTHDLCEEPTELCITGTDACSGSNINIEYLLFLDLDGDGVMETVVNSVNTGIAGLGWNNVLYNNLNTPNFSGGTPRAFDSRPVNFNQKWGFAIQETVVGNNKTACVRWNTQQAQNTYVVPDLPHGTHKIKWFISDGCGNNKEYEYSFTVKDCKAPTVVCLNGLSTNIMPTGMIPMWASDFLQYTEDNCTPTGQIKIGIRKCGAGTGFPLNPDGSPQISVTFDCTELGTQCVELWAIDAEGNADYCETYVIVQDNLGNCPTADHINVAGALKTEMTEGVEEGTVSIDGTSSFAPPYSYFDLSDQAGVYEVMDNVPLAATFVIVPEKDDNPLNGVTTYDLVKISQHILGTEPFDSPYKMIAADANKSGSITSFDIVELRKLILGIYTALPNNTSWRFVDKSFQFPNLINPFQTLFPETISVADAMSHQMGEDFVGVKVGDVNNTAVTNATMQAEERSVGTALFDIEDRDVTAGETFEVIFKAAEQLKGFQFTMLLNGLEVLSVVESNNVSNANFGLIFKDVVTVSIDDAQVFTLRFRATKSGKLSEMLGVSGSITRAEAYQDQSPITNQPITKMGIAFRFGGKTISGIGFELYQNQPNPFVHKTSIGFYLPEAAEATLSVFDESGRVVWQQKGQFAKGENTIALDRALINTTGLLYYKLETAIDSATKKMIQMR